MSRVPSDEASSRLITPRPAWPRQLVDVVAISPLGSSPLLFVLSVCIYTT